MSTHNDDLPLEDEQKSSVDADKRSWERPILRRLAANRAQAGRGHNADERHHLQHESS